MIKEKDILSFDGTEYDFLSNFYEAEILWEGKKYKTVEHLFQARKTTNKEDHEYVRNSNNASIAKKRGKNEIKCRKDWDSIRVQVMRECLELKFSQHADLQEKLIATGHARLVEGNWWNDYFWGVCKGKGQNWLGQLLMELRTQLQIKL